MVSRVELDCRAYHHRKHWQESVLPRLYEFARMVYRFRGDDMLRFRYLLAGPVRDGGAVQGDDAEASLRQSTPLLLLRVFFFRFLSLVCLFLV